MRFDYQNALLKPDGTLHEFTIRTEGKMFHCHCKCNVFHKPNKDNLNLYKCNCCGTEYESD